MKPITTSSDIAPSALSAWTDVDVSSLVPAGATGVVLRIVNTDASVYRHAGVRPNGSTVDIRGAWQHHTGGAVVVTQLDANRIFEAYKASNDIKIYAIGYTEPNEVVFLTNPVDVWPDTTQDAWTAASLSAYISGGDTPTAGMFTSYGQDSYDTLAIRAYGSTDGYTYGELDFEEMGYCMRKLDANKSISVYAGTYQNPAIIYFTGYFKASNAVFQADPTDVTPGSTSTWTTLPALAKPGAFGYYDGCTDNYAGKTGLRKKGTTDSFQVLPSSMVNGYVGYGGLLSESDANGEIEGWKESATSYLRYFGYIGPMQSARHPLLLAPF